MNVHDLLEASLVQIQEEAAKKSPDFLFRIVTEFDPSGGMILTLPEDLTYAFVIYMNQALDALKANKEHTTPTLKIKTVTHEDRVVITFENNGLNASENLQKYFSQSFFNYKVIKNLIPTAEEALSLNLVLAHDIIVHVHQGTLKVLIGKNQELRLTITLPLESEF